MEHKFRQEESREYFYKIINSIADPIFVKDREHRWVLLNEAHAQMIGIPVEEMLGKTDYDYFPKEQAKVFWDKDEVVFQTGQENVNEELWTDSNGNIHTIVTKKTLYTDNKGNKFIVGVIRDITDLKNTQNKLQQAKDTQSRFTSIVSHELRTPLAAIRTGVNIILDGLSGPINSEQRDFLEIVKKNIERLSRLINDVLDFQKLDSGKMNFNMKVNDLNELVEEVCKSMRHLVEKKKLKLELELENKIPKIKIDKDKIIQVIVNLVNNAIAFTDKGSIVIISKLDGPSAHIMVKDTGAGIKKESLDKLFNPFEQAEREDTGRREGTGLGLAICKEIVSRHNGKIWVESESGKGSIFHFILPLENKDE